MTNGEYLRVIPKNQYNRYINQHDGAPPSCRFCGRTIERDERCHSKRSAKGRVKHSCIKHAREKNLI